MSIGYLFNDNKKVVIPTKVLGLNVQLNRRILDKVQRRKRWKSSKVNLLRNNIGYLGQNEANITALC